MCSPLLLCFLLSCGWLLLGDCARLTPLCPALCLAACHFLLTFDLSSRLLPPLIGSLLTFALSSHLLSPHSCFLLMFALLTFALSSHLRSRYIFSLLVFALMFSYDFTFLGSSVLSECLKACLKGLHLSPLSICSHLSVTLTILSFTHCSFLKSWFPHTKSNTALSLLRPRLSLISEGCDASYCLPLSQHLLSSSQDSPPLYSNASSVTSPALFPSFLRWLGFSR